MAFKGTFDNAIEAIDNIGIIGRVIAHLLRDARGNHQAALSRLSANCILALEDINIELNKFSLFIETYPDFHGKTYQEIENSTFFFEFSFFSTRKMIANKLKNLINDSEDFFRDTLSVARCIGQTEGLNLQVRPDEAILQNIDNIKNLPITEAIERLRDIIDDVKGIFTPNFGVEGFGDFLPETDN